MTTRLGKKNKISAEDAKSNAQQIAFAPIMFQASLALRDLGILPLLQRENRDGLDVPAIAAELNLPAYGVAVLLEAGLGAGIVYLEDRRYHISKTGYFLLKDKLTRVNMDFVADICYRPMSNLQQAVTTGKPAGLKEFGPWTTLYEGLTRLPEKAQQSWFEFDHFYSDAAFSEALALVFARDPQHIIDVGGNTGKWSRRCLEYNDSVRMTIVDLAPQLERATSNLVQAGFAGRFETRAINVLDDGDEFPETEGVIWMSQFLDCFSLEEIVRILARARRHMAGASSLFVLEPFWDRQQFDAATFSLVNISLYFTCVANGNSKIYHSEDIKRCAEAAGLELVAQTDHIGLGHTLLEYQPR